MGAFYRWVFEGVWPPVEEAAISRHVSLLPSNWFQFNKPRKRKHAASSSRSLPPQLLSQMLDQHYSSFVRSPHGTYI